MNPSDLLRVTACAALLLLAACSDDTTAQPDAGGPDLKAVADAGCGGDLGGPVAPIPTPKIHTPRWAFEPWISKDISDTQDTYDFVNGFAKHDIPVGAVVLDSPWETQYNTFIPNPKRYPNFKKLINDLHARKIKVVLWITQMVNSASVDMETGGDTYSGPSPNFDEGKRCDFFVNNGGTSWWWKGMGAGLDFFNPRAVQWWHRQQDHVLDMGIDGWKLDFGESYIPGTELLTAQGKKALQKYSEEYYRDFLAYGVHKRGKEFVTMVRGYDKSYQFEGRFFARPEHAPVVWAGDNRRDWFGLADALDHVLRSARAKYVNVGSDIGGYLDFDDTKMTVKIPFDQDVFVRWVAVGALSPFMQLHGRANLTPWTVTPKTTETIAIYRYWSWLHHEMVPFWYSLAQEAYAAGTSLLHPVGEPKDWPGDYRFVVGQALLVAPILDKTSKRDVPLPAGAAWYDWWAPGNAPYQGGQTLKSYDATDQKRVPLFIREGAIIPLTVSNAVTGLGSAKSKGHHTVLVYPAVAKSAFRLHEVDQKVTTIESQRSAGKTVISLSRATLPVILQVRADTMPTTANLGSTALLERANMTALESNTSGWYKDTAAKNVWIKIQADTGSQTVTLN